MPPALALILTLAFIFFLFWRESREKTDVSSALWVPLIWYFITASRFLSQWLSMLGILTGASSLDDGSPIDRAVFFGLIAAGLYVLCRRRVQLSEFARRNVWLIAFLAYCFLAICWSDFPLIALKRWIKVLGHPIMALIILTEPNPEEAVRRVLKRSAYLLIPLSILLGKYFPQYGRAYNSWTGEGYYLGVTTDKNALGHVCMIVGVFFFWNAMQAFRMKNRKARRDELLLSVGFLGLTCWLLKMANSATSLATMLMGILTIGLLGLPFMNKRLIGMYVLFGILAFVAADSLFGIYGKIVGGLGRNMTLTDRTSIWQLVLSFHSDPIFGVGFESFWLGERLKDIWSTTDGAGITEAHNGYLETYLNLGFIGVALMIGLLLGTYRKVRLDLLSRFEFGRLRIGLLFAILVYNLTEAAFASVHLVYTVFFLIAIDYPVVRRSRARRLRESVRKEGEEAIISPGA
jgi:O-antigen ligase